MNAFSSKIVSKYFKYISDFRSRLMELGQYFLDSPGHQSHFVNPPNGKLLWMILKF